MLKNLKNSIIMPTLSSYYLSLKKDSCYNLSNFKTFYTRTYFILRHLRLFHGKQLVRKVTVFNELTVTPRCVFSGKKGPIIFRSLCLCSMFVVQIRHTCGTFFGISHIHLPSFNNKRHIFKKHHNMRRGFSHLRVWVTCCLCVWFTVKCTAFQVSPSRFNMKSFTTKNNSMSPMSMLADVDMDHLLNEGQRAADDWDIFVTPFLTEENGQSLEERLKSRGDVGYLRIGDI